MIMVEAITDSLLNPDYKAEEGKAGITGQLPVCYSNCNAHWGNWNKKFRIYQSPVINTTSSLYKLEVDTENIGERYISFIPYVDLIQIEDSISCLNRAGAGSIPAIFGTDPEPLSRCPSRQISGFPG